jgi:hypothetical protein
MSIDDRGERRMHTFHVRVGDDEAIKLLAAAQARKMLPNKFASRLMRLMLRDNLINAILDDDGSFEAGRKAAA